MKIYTIRDVAEMAGVSVTTVSRVLNDRPDVSRETKEKVRRVMAKLHFVGNANARGLKQADGESVAIIIRGRKNPFLNTLTEAMLLCPRGEKTVLLTEYIDEQDDEFLHALTLMNRQRIAGLILKIRFSKIGSLAHPRRAGFPGQPHRRAVPCAGWGEHPHGIRYRERCGHGDGACRFRDHG